MDPGKKNFDFKFVERNCPTCKNSLLKKIGMRGGKFQRSNKGIECQIVQCEKCSLIFPSPFPIPKNTSSLYSDPHSYFENSGDIFSRVKDMDLLVKDFLKKNLKRPLKILDYGAGRGEFLAACAYYNEIEATGIEISEESMEIAKNTLKVKNILNCNLSDLIDKGHKFDAISLNAVIEHVHDPNQLVQEVSDLLNTGGIVYIDCPREPNLLTVCANFWYKITGNKAVLNLQPTWEPYHVYGFNPKALSILMKKHGLSFSSYKVWAAPEVKSSEKFKDKIICFFATQINRFANLINFSSNMYVWVKKD